MRIAFLVRTRRLGFATHKRCLLGSGSSSLSRVDVPMITAHFIKLKLGWRQLKKKTLSWCCRRGEFIFARQVNFVADTVHTKSIIVGFQSPFGKAGFWLACFAPPTMVTHFSMGNKKTLLIAFPEDCQNQAFHVTYNHKHEHQTKCRMRRT